jgi:serine/threonine protein kinase
MLFRNHYFPALPPNLIKENGKLKNSAEEKTILEKFSEEGIHLAEEKEYLYIKGKNGVYVIHQHEISSGSFGKICFGYDILTGKWFAAKFIKIEKYDQCEYNSLFKAKKLIENEIFQHKDDVIILMELATGHELYELKFGDPAKNKKAVKWPLALWLEICIQLLEELQKLHQLYLIHGDLKVENALYSLAYGILSIIDYGFAGEMKEGVLQKERLKGTCFPPELLKELPPYSYNVKTDIYSMGILVHELLYGERLELRSYSDNLEELKFVPLEKPLPKDPILRKHVERMHHIKPKCRPSLLVSLTFFKKYREKYNLQHPNEVKIVSVLKEKAKLNEYQRISEAKIIALEPWKALQSSLVEFQYSKYLNLDWFDFFAEKNQASTQAAQKIEAALLNEDLENAKKIATEYIKNFPNEGLAQVLKNKFKLYLEEKDIQPKQSLVRVLA